MFIGRESELESLQYCYENAKGFAMAVIFGRRRVGKTRLIQEFVKDKPNIFFSAVKTRKKAEDNLWGLSKVLSGSDGDDFPVYSSFPAAFEEIARRASKGRLILVMDEYPYLEDESLWFSSLLQNTIDHLFANTGLFLILSGSSVSFIEDEVLGSKNPLVAAT